MASKKKNTQPQAPDDALDALDAPALTPVPVPERCLPPASATQWPWPESTETRSLLVSFTDHDRSDIARKFATIQRQKESIEEEKKLQAKAQQQRIDALEAEISHMAESINKDGENRLVECVWHYEVSGVDECGKWVVHPEYKTLVRQDTLEIVATAKITDEERQMVMPLADTGLPEAECEVILQECGYQLADNDTPGIGETPFCVLRLSDGSSMDISGDSRLAALRNAVAAVRTMADDACEEWSQLGAAARTNNMVRSRCPYEPGTAAAQYWKEGWDKQDADIESTAVSLLP